MLYIADMISNMAEVLPWKLNRQAEADGTTTDRGGSAYHCINKQYIGSTMGRFEEPMSGAGICWSLSAPRRRPFIELDGGSGRSNLRIELYGNPIPRAGHGKPT